MEDKKDFLKKILIIALVIIIAICGFIFSKNDDEEILIYNELIEGETLDIEENVEEINFANSENETIKIYITGEVNSPGVKELEDGARIEDAINKANGLTNEADISQVNLAYSLKDGQKIYIPNINEKIDEYVTDGNGEGIIEEDNNKISGKININNANVNELCELPGVGQSLAEKIITYRNENGKFKTIDDLKNVTGIGEKKFESLKEYILVK